MPFVDTGRISLHFEDIGKDGPPILLLHELGGSSASWHAVMPLLAPRRVIAVDLRGAGRSEKPQGGFALSEVADDLRDLAATLAIPAFDIIGSALGSLVGALLALRHPALVRRMVLCAVAEDMAGRTADYLAERAERVRAVGMRGVMEASLANAFPDAHAAARQAYRPIYLGNDPAAYAEMSLALAQLRLTPADWHCIRAPVLVASGAHDFIWPPERGRRVAALIPGARFGVLEQAGHFPHLQAPDALARMALDFLAGG